MKVQMMISEVHARQHAYQTLAMAFLARTALRAVSAATSHVACSSALTWQASVAERAASHFSASASSSSWVAGRARILQLHANNQARHFSSNNQDDQEQDQNPHPDFPALSVENKYQGALEKAEVRQAFNGLVESPWSDIYESPLDSVLSALVAQPLLAVRRAMLTPVRARVSHIAERMVAEQVEGAFNKDEFLEGAKEAVSAVFELWGQQEFDTLQGMCSEKLVERMKIAQFELEANHKLQLSSLKADVNSIELGGVNLWSQTHVGQFDEAWADEATPATSKSWLAVTVHVDATLTASYSQATGKAVELLKTIRKPQASEEGAEGQAEAGQQAAEAAPAEAAAASKAETSSGSEPVVASKSMRKQGGVLFLRGPLPRGFSTQLTNPWRIIAWW